MSEALPFDLFDSFDARRMSEMVDAACLMARVAEMLVDMGRFDQVIQLEDEPVTEHLSTQILIERPHTILDEVRSLEIERGWLLRKLVPDILAPLLLPRTVYFSSVHAAVERAYGKQYKIVRFNNRLCRFTWEEGPEFDRSKPNVYIWLELGDKNDVFPGLKKPIDWAYLSMSRYDLVSSFEAMLPHTQAGTLLLAHPFDQRKSHYHELVRRVRREPFTEMTYLPIGKGLLKIRFTRGQRDTHVGRLVAA